MKSSGHHHHHHNSDREPLLDLRKLKEAVVRFSKHLDHSEDFLNVIVVVAVVLFVGYQLVSLLLGIKRSVKPLATPIGNKAEKVDKACGEESLYTDLQEHIVRDCNVPFKLPSFNDETTLRNSQIFYEDMKLRRSIRAFSSRNVPMKVIQNLVKTAGTSPSVGNLQPWKFCVVANDSIKQTIREILEADERQNYVSRKKGAAWVVDVSQLQDNWKRPYITDAPFLIVVCHDVFLEPSENGRIPERVYSYNELSTSIAIGILLAAIQNAGLSTVVTSPLNAGPQISHLLRRPEHESVLMLLPLGYAAEDAVVNPAKRKPVESITKLY